MSVQGRDTWAGKVDGTIEPSAWATDGRGADRQARRRRHGRAIRVAVVGSTECAVSLEQELVAAGITRYEMVGCVTPAPRGIAEASGATLGHLEELEELVQRHRIDLLLLAAGVPRIRVFDRALACCVRLDVRVQEVPAFYEKVFRRVPVADLNAAWFQYVLHPRYVARSSPDKRALDIVVALALFVLLLPAVLLIALVIKLDGGPVLFRQVRMGERGRPFILYKLRTMRVEPAGPPRWTVAADPRVTRVGRVLRRLHLDELPQIYNVLRGEMSMVGPRPEQPEFVYRLAATLPFYAPRHLVKPGITGWAQVRCGYAGSESGSVWKLCHDLYYLKYRSLAFDLSIFARTVWTVIREGESDTPLRDAPFVMHTSLEVQQSSLEVFEGQLGVLSAHPSGGAEAPTRHRWPVPPEVVPSAGGESAGWS